MNSSIKIIQKKTALKSGVHRIYLRVTIDRKSKYYSTPYCSSLNEWDENQGEFKLKFTNSISFNKSLRIMKDEAWEIISKLEREFKNYNLLLFDKFYSLQNFKYLSVVGLFEKQIELYKDNRQISYALSMEDSLNALKSFKKNIDEYNFENVDYQFLNEFESFLRKRGANDGGIASYMRNIRTIYNKAIKYKNVNEEFYPFKEFKISKFKKKNIKKALTAEDLQKIIEFDINKLNMARNARYAYIFSYYARGMNFTDLAELKWTDLDNYHFNYFRNKTDVLLKIKLPNNKIVNEMLQFYKIYRPFDTPYIFPILKKEIFKYDELELKNRKDSVRTYYNEQLKLLLKECNINKNITFYTARHTFATNALRNDVNIHIIKQALGHKKLSTTENYLDDFQESEVDDIIGEIF